MNEEKKEITLSAAERGAARFFKRNHYHVLDRCCAACKFLEAGYEGECWCKLAHGEQEDWIVGDIEPYGLCDQFVALTLEEE